MCAQLDEPKKALKLLHAIISNKWYVRLAAFWYDTSLFNNSQIIIIIFLI
jgi:hypothetical protein